jgi:hypothetical protein
MLGPIRAVTTTANNLDAVIDAYTLYLGYKVVEKGVVAPATAAGWGAPTVAGKPLVVMMPESGAGVYLRFVEQAAPAGFEALTSWGWNATEILVQDVEALAARLAHSPFRMIGQPKPLDGLPDIHAMQVIGPAGEALYLTWKKPVTPEVPVAQSFVDYCFIAVAGGPDIAAMRAFYQSRFGNESGLPRPVHIGVLSDANHLPAETTHPLSTVALGGASKIELDQYPPGTGARPRIAGGLPPGMALVTFEHGRFDGADLSPVGGIHEAMLPPYRDHQSITVAGAAGELIELIEV